MRQTITGNIALCFLLNTQCSGGALKRKLMKTRNTILSAAILSSLSINAFAQKDEIETISIAGTHTPISVGQIAGSVTVIDETLISASGAIGVTDLLRTVAGVNIGQTGPSGSLTEVRFRGSESNHVMVLVDGIAINDVGQGGITDFSHLLLANVARIEILRGPQSAIWGSNAIAGVISITTKKATSNNVKPSVSLYVGSHNTYGANANASKQSAKLGFFVNASTHKTKGENISREGDENDAYSNNDLSSGINYDFDESNKLSISARLLNFSRDGDVYNFATGLVSDGNSTAKGEQLSVGVNWQFTPNSSASEQGIYSQLLSLQYSSQNTDNYSENIFTSTSEGEKLRLLWSNRFQFATNKWINIGIESTTEDFEQRGASADDFINQTQSQDTHSFVSDGLYGISEDITLSASFRYDNNQDFDDASSYRLGVTYAINNDWRVFISQGQAIKNPTFVERFGYFPGSFLGNPNLAPEQQKSTEAGIEGSFDLLSIQLNWFDAKLEDEILGFVFDPVSGQFTAQNADQESKRQGAEISVQGQLNKLSWRAQYSYLDATEGNAVELRRSKHSGSVSTSYVVNEQHQFYIQADYSGTKFDRFFPPYPLPSEVVSLKSRWLVSVNYTYNYSESLAANLRISNIFDEEYEDVYGYNTDGSNVLLSVKYGW